MTGTLTLQNSTNLDLAGNALTLGTLTVSSSSRVLMQTGTPALTLTTGVTWNSVGVWNETQLTAGTIHVKGTWGMNCSASGVFNAGGTHTVSFEGTAAQSVGVRVGASGSPDQFFFGGHVEPSALVDHLFFRPNLEMGVGNSTKLLAANFEFKARRATRVP